MRWQQLFADLQAQFEAEEAAGEQARVGLAGAGRGRASWARRPAARCGGPPAGRWLRGRGPVSGVAASTSGRTGCCVEDDGARQCLVAPAAVRAVGGLGRRTAVPESAGAGRAVDWTYAAPSGAWPATAAPSRSCSTTGRADRDARPGRGRLRGAGRAPRRPAPASEAVHGVRAVVISGDRGRADGDCPGRPDGSAGQERASCSTVSRACPPRPAPCRRGPRRTSAG